MMNHIASNNQYIRVIFENHAMLRLTLCRANKCNALTREMVTELIRLCRLIQQTPQLRVLVIGSDATTFCAGFDLYELSRLSNPQVRQFNRSYADLLNELVSMPQLLIVEVVGGAYGGGMGLIASADFVVAESRAKFAMPEVKLGLLPSQILPYVIAKIGPQPARRLSLLAQEISASEAKDMGLVDKIVASQKQLSVGTENLYTQSLACSPNAVRQTKKILLNLSQSSKTTYAEYAADAFMHAFANEGRQRIEQFFKSKDEAEAVKNVEV